MKVICYLRNVSFVVSLIFLIVLIYSFWFCYQYGDDFIFLNILKEMNVGEAILYKYINWDGRHFSPGGLLQMLGFAYLGPFFSLLLGLICMGYATWLALRVLVSEVGIKDVVAIIALFLIGLFPFYKDVLFWQTGVIYQYFYLQSILIFFIYRVGDIKLCPYLEYGLVFLLALNSQNFNLAVLVYIWVLDLWDRDKSFFSKRKMVYSAIIIFSTAIISLAPGNFERIEVGTDSKPQFANLIEMVFVYLKAFNYTKYFVFTGFVGGLIVKAPTIDKWKKEFFSLVAAGIFSLAPFVLYPDLARIRVFFSLGLFLFFAGFVLGNLPARFIKSKFLRWVPSLVILVGLYVLIEQVSLLKKHSTLILKRHAYLIEKSDSDFVEYGKIPKDYNLFIIRSPDYTKEWDKDFLKFYSIKSYTEI